MVYEIWLAWQDHAVCQRCAELHGHIFPRGQGPQPPLHPGCRCSREVYYISQGDEPPLPVPEIAPEWWFINDIPDPRPRPRPKPARDPWDIIGWWDNLIRPDKKRGN